LKLITVPIGTVAATSKRSVEITKFTMSAAGVFGAVESIWLNTWQNAVVQVSAGTLVAQPGRPFCVLLAATDVTPAGTPLAPLSWIAPKIALSDSVLNTLTVVVNVIDPPCRTVLLPAVIVRDAAFATDANPAISATAIQVVKVRFIVSLLIFCLIRRQYRQELSC
jgi:hypothetical protein